MEENESSSTGPSPGSEHTSSPESNSDTRKLQTPDAAATNHHGPDNRDLQTPAFHLTPALWTGVVIVILLGGVVNLRRFDRKRLRRPYSIPIVRHETTTHVLSQLGVEVALPHGWIYLSIATDSEASHTTLMHVASQSIVSLRKNRLDEWPPKDHTAKQESFAWVDVDWVDLQNNQKVPIDEPLLAARTCEWVELDPRFLGRLTPNGNGDQPGDPDLMMILVTHQTGDRLNSAIRDLCDAIRFIGS